MKFRAVRGTKDIFPVEAQLFQHIISCAENIFSLYGYHQIYTPLIEEESLFIRSLGKDTEVVQKQMFAIKHNEKRYVLRPEATAGVVRAYLERHLDKKEGFVKFYYVGPMFRAERPQKGRLRQFHHLGVEAIGSLSPMLDAEVILLAKEILEALEIDDFQIEINTLGCVQDRERLSSSLALMLKDRIRNLCMDCQERINRGNILRALDCKNENCRKIISEIDINRNDYLCNACITHFEEVTKNLESVGVRYKENRYLVRGLDYYTRTVFEIVHSSLGSQDALGAGGRYDNLVEELGGSSTGAIGFAFGIERLAIVLEKKCKKVSDSGPEVYIISLDGEAKREGFKLLSYLRKNNIACEFDFENKSLKAQMREANNLGVKFVVILGEDELKSHTFSLKNMQNGTQKKVKKEEIIKNLKKIGD
jgi:histidyl-tRNA synthetase